MGRKRLEDYLRFAVSRGELRIDDFTLAAEQFSDLAKSRLWMRAVFGIQSDFCAEEISAVVASAVDTFLARYGA
jgi:hypothetical protein